MTQAEVVSLILAIVVVVITVLGNALIVYCRAKGWPRAADFVARMTPFAVAAASSKTREEAIDVLVNAVLELPHTPEAKPVKEAAFAVAVESTPKPPTAAPLPMLLLGIFAWTMLTFPVACDLPPAQSAAAVQTAIDVSGAFCKSGPDAIGGKAGGVVKMICRFVGDAISNDGTGPAGVGTESPTFDVDVPADQLADFCARNHCEAQ